MIAFVTDGNKLIWDWEGAMRVAVVDASDIGLAPGVWPEETMVVPLIGNGELFVKQDPSFGYMPYVQRHGMMTIRVFND